MDVRKQQLKTDISRCLATSKNYDEFEQKMKALKYGVIKMRGIAFRDQQKVYTKGSEVGYSLATIERILAQKQGQKIEPERQLKPGAQRQANNMQSTSNPAIENRIQKGIQSTLNILIKPDSGPGGQDDSQSIEEEKRRRKHNHRH